MKKRTVIITIFAFLALFLGLISFSAISKTNSTNTKQLKLLHVIIRHGKRTPADTYPNDPYINETFHPIGWGQLTNQGKLDLYNIGVFLRERYGDYLGTFYSPNEYFTQSTDVDRTKTSVQLINAALWPPEKEQKWGPLNWQPIPVHSEPLAEDNLLLVRKPCAQYHLEMERLMKTEEIQRKLRENKELFNDLTRFTGNLIRNFDDVQDLFSTLKAENEFGLKLPKWTTNYYPNKLLEPTIFSYTLNAYNDKLNRLKGGVFLKKLMTDWKRKINGNLEPKERLAYLYGGHDSTIVNLLRTLKIWDPQLPNYGIMILLEFSFDKTTEKYGLEVYLKNSTSPNGIFQLTIPKCEKFCEFFQLEKLTKNVIPINWDEECKTNDSSYVPPPLGGP